MQKLPPKRNGTAALNSKSTTLLALQDVEMTAHSDAMQILTQLRTGQIGLKQKRRGSAENIQRFDPPTAWADFTQANIAHTMPVNTIEQSKIQLHKQGTQEPCVTYGTRWLKLMESIDYPLNRHSKVKGANQVTPHMINELTFTER